MVRGLEPDQLERLLEARHRAKIWSIVAVAVVVALGALSISANATVPVGLCVVAGLGIGRLVNTPYLRLLKELGLTRQEGLLIPAAERDRRTGRAALPARVRARREQVAAAACLACGLAATVVLVVSAVYFLGKANQTVDENAPADTWFAVSVVAGFVSLVLAPSLLWMARVHRDNATAWRAADVP